MDDNTIANYERDGYAILRDVLEPALVAEANEFVDWMLKKRPDLPAQKLNSCHTRDEPFLHHLVSRPALLDIVSHFIGPDIATYGPHFLCKPPHDRLSVAWHQDQAYWPLEPPVVVTLWVAVTPSTRENGCMRVIPGSHRGNCHDHSGTAGPKPKNAMITGMDQRIVDESQAVDLELTPGDLSIHHSNIIHGSDGNQSGTWRRAVAIRYMPTYVRVTRDSGTQWHLAGITPPDRNYHPVPTFTDDNMPFAGMETYYTEAEVMA